MNLNLYLHILKIFIVLKVLAAILVVSNFARCQEVTDTQLKESDIIKITVEKKETTKSLSHNSSRNTIKTPMTMLPFKGKPMRHTAAPANMVEPGNKQSGKTSNKRPQPETATVTNSFETEHFETFPAQNSITEFPDNFENDMQESDNDIIYTNRDLEIYEESAEDFENVTDTIDASRNQTDDVDVQLMSNLTQVEPSDNSTSRDNSTNYEEIKEVIESVFEDYIGSSSLVKPIESSTDGNVDVDNATISEESGNSHLKDYEQLCEHSGNGRLQYVWGDAFSNTNCLGPNMQRYPT